MARQNGRKRINGRAKFAAAVAVPQTSVTRTRCVRSQERTHSRSRPFDPDRKHGRGSPIAAAQPVPQRFFASGIDEQVQLPQLGLPHIHGERMNLGTWRNGVFEGKKYRPDGALAEEGRFEKDGKLSVGVSYDAAGARTDVNLPAERAAAARTAAQEEQQRAREQAAQAEQQFRTSLQAMNPGQLFARADELNAQGDKARAREVQRTLVSRFPDHPLAATAAQQMAGGAGTGSSAGASAASTAPARPAGGRLSSQACEAMKQTVIATKVPPNASITASQETVMFMTKTVLDMIDGNCPTEPGVTPAQIEAERKLRQQQYAAAESACNAVQAGGRRCTPQVHTAARAASTPPANASTVGSTPRTPTISYDPVTGRCIGDREACACQPGLGNSKEYGECPRSGGSSGGGIRTAR